MRWRKPWSTCGRSSACRSKSARWRRRLELTSMHSAASRRDAPAITASSRRRRKSKEQGFGIDRLPRIKAVRFAYPRKVENPRFNSAETGSKYRLGTVRKCLTLGLRIAIGGNHDDRHVGSRRLGFRQKLKAALSISAAGA